MPPAPSPADSSLVEAHDGRYVTRINGRTEYVLVRMVQSLMQFMRQLREILGGAEGARPAIRTAPLTLPADDLTRIAGLSAEQAARLRTAGVTTYTRLAQLSPDELRMITLTPGGATADPAHGRCRRGNLPLCSQEANAYERQPIPSPSVCGAGHRQLESYGSGDRLFAAYPLVARTISAPFPNPKASEEKALSASGLLRLLDKIIGAHLFQSRHAAGKATFAIASAPDRRKFRQQLVGLL
jgi:hypothetical protein